RGWLAAEDRQLRVRPRPVYHRAGSPGPGPAGSRRCSRPGSAMSASPTAMTDTPRFSIIIPTYNRPAPLHQCLAALRRQAYPPDAVEVIVVDDGSRKRLEPVVASFPGVRLIRQVNAGPAAARNTGAAAAT